MNRRFYNLTKEKLNQKGKTYKADDKNLAIELPPYYMILFQPECCIIQTVKGFVPISYELGNETFIAMLLKNL